MRRQLSARLFDLHCGQVGELGVGPFREDNPMSFGPQKIGNSRAATRWWRPGIGLPDHTGFGHTDLFAFLSDQVTHIHRPGWLTLGGAARLVTRTRAEVESVA